MQHRFNNQCCLRLLHNNNYLVVSLHLHHSILYHYVMYMVLWYLLSEVVLVSTLHSCWVVSLLMG